MMYKQVDKMQPVARIYEQQLLNEGVLTPELAASMKAGIQKQMEDAYQESKNVTYKAEDWVTPEWEKIKVFDKDEAKISGVEVSRLKDIGAKITHLPKDAEFHRLIKKIFEARNKSI